MTAIRIESSTTTAIRKHSHLSLSHNTTVKERCTRRLWVVLPLPFRCRLLFLYVLFLSRLVHVALILHARPSQSSSLTGFVFYLSLPARLPVEYPLALANCCRLFVPSISLYKVLYFSVSLLACCWCFLKLRRALLFERMQLVWRQRRLFLLHSPDLMESTGFESCD